MRLLLLLALILPLTGQSRLAKWAAIGSCVSGAVNVGENAYAVSTGHYREFHPLVAGPTGAPSIWRLSLAQGALCASEIWLSRRRWEIRSSERPIAIAPVISLSLSGSLGSSLFLTSVRDIRGFK